MLQCAVNGAPEKSGQISFTLSHSVTTRSKRVRETVEMLAGLPRDVDPALRHDAHRIGVQRLRVAAGALGLDGTA